MENIVRTKKASVSGTEAHENMNQFIRFRNLISPVPLRAKCNRKLLLLKDLRTSAGKEKSQESVQIYITYSSYFAYFNNHQTLEPKVTGSNPVGDTFHRLGAECDGSLPVRGN
jgi:hypothetical protein